MRELMIVYSVTIETTCSQKKTEKVNQVRVKNVRNIITTVVVLHPFS